MRIGIDARMFRQGLGIGRYIERLLSYLPEEKDANEYIIFLLPHMMGEYQPTDPRFRTVAAPFRWYSLREQILFPILLRSYHLDLVHFPHFNVPIAYRKSFIVTIHDLILFKHPQSSTVAASTRHAFIHTVKYWCYRLAIRSAVRRAVKIIAVSGGVKSDIISFLGVSHEKVVVVYEGTDVLSSNAASLPSEIRQPYALSVGNAYPHKNLNVLLDVFERLERAGSNLTLVLCGQEDYFQKKLLKNITDRKLVNVVHLGMVSDSVLRALYEHARLYVFPSVEEGFGLPGLEAMRAGIPVCASASSVLPEIYGDAAVYFDPHDINDILTTVTRVASDDLLRKMLHDRGSACIRRYSWKLMTRAIHDIYISCV